MVLISPKYQYCQNITKNPSKPCFLNIPRSYSKQGSLTHIQHKLYTRVCAKKEENEEVSVPQRYLDPVTGQILQEPYINVQTGEIYDKKTLKDWFEKAEELKDILPLPDFSAAIKQFQNSRNPINNDGQQTVQNDSQQTEILQLAVNFQQKEQILEDQNEKIKAAKTEVEKSLKELRESFLDFPKSRKVLESVMSETSHIPSCFDPENISNLEKKLDEELTSVQKYLGEVQINFKQFYKFAVKLCQKQKQFAQNIKKLEFYEKDLTVAREQFIKKHAQLGIVSSFKTQVSIKSPSYFGTEVSQSELQKIFSQNILENKTLNLPPQKIVRISLIQSTEVKNLQIVSTGSTVTLEIGFNNKYPEIMFSNCRFYGVELHIKSDFTSLQYRLYKASVSNCQSYTSPGTGIAITNCKSCEIEQTQIHNSKHSGIFIQNAEFCTIKNVEVSSSGEYGVVVKNTRGEIMDSKIQNSNNQGIYKDTSSFFKSSRVTLIENNT